MLSSSSSSFPNFPKCFSSLSDHKSVETLVLESDTTLHFTDFTISILYYIRRPVLYFQEPVYISTTRRDTIAFGCHWNIYIYIYTHIMYRNEENVSCKRLKILSPHQKFTSSLYILSPAHNKFFYFKLISLFFFLYNLHDYFLTRSTRNNDPFRRKKKTKERKGK